MRRRQCAQRCRCGTDACYKCVHCAQYKNENFYLCASCIKQAHLHHYALHVFAFGEFKRDDQHQLFQLPPNAALQQLQNNGLHKEECSICSKGKLLGHLHKCMDPNCTMNVCENCWTDGTGVESERHNYACFFASLSSLPLLFPLHVRNENDFVLIDNNVNHTQTDLEPPNSPTILQFSDDEEEEIELDSFVVKKREDSNYYCGEFENECINSTLTTSQTNVNESVQPIENSNDNVDSPIKERPTYMEIKKEADAQYSSANSLTIKEEDNYAMGGYNTATYSAPYATPYSSPNSSNYVEIKEEDSQPYSSTYSAPYATPYSIPNSSNYVEIKEEDSQPYSKAQYENNSTDDESSGYLEIKADNNTKGGNNATAYSVPYATPYSSNYLGIKEENSSQPYSTQYGNDSTDNESSGYLEIKAENGQQTTSNYDMNYSEMGIEGDTDDSDDDATVQKGNNRNDNHTVAKETENQQKVTMDTSNKPMNWNYAFQAIISRKVVSKSEEIQKHYDLAKLALQFENIATQIGRVIIQERNFPANKKTIKQLNVGGRAGGEKLTTYYKFLNNGIFFKFAVDMDGFYGGDSLAQKAASLELKGLRSYFQFIQEEKQHLLNVPLMVVIDYWGCRLIATCELPIGSSTLKYGSADAGKTVFTDNDELNQLMRQAGEFIGMKGHVVGFSRDKANHKFIYGPCDIEGHVGKDNRYYVVDTARLYAPEAPSRYFLGTKLLAGTFRHGSWNKLEISKHIINLQIPVQRWQQCIPSILGDGSSSEPFDTLTVLGGTLLIRKLQKPEHVVNSVASCLAKRVIFGHALFLPQGYSGKILYNLFRPEFLMKFKAICPLSSDCFTAFGRNKAKVHNTEARQATVHLMNTVIPEFVKQLDSNRVIPLHSFQLTSAMHEHGINMRYLGVVRALSKSNVVRMILAIEMIMRSVKYIIRESMRNTFTEDALKSTIVYFLNLLFGNAIASTIFWNVQIKLQLTQKFGAYNYMVWAVDEQKDLKSYIQGSKLLLFERLQTQLGVRLQSSVEQQLEAHWKGDILFRKADIVEISLRVKRLVKRNVISEIFTTKANEIQSTSEDANSNKSALLLEQLNINCSLFGSNSAEATANYLQLAFFMLNIKTFNFKHATQHIASEAEAHELALIYLAEIEKANEIPLEVAVGTYYLKALVAMKQYLGQADDASWTSSLSLFLCSFSVLCKMFGGEPFSFPTTCYWRQGYEGVSRELQRNTKTYCGHPFSLVIIEKIVQLLCMKRLYTAAAQFTSEFAKLWDTYAFPISRTAVVLLFGDSVPASYALALFWNQLSNVSEASFKCFRAISKHKQQNDELKEKQWLKNVFFFENLGDVCNSPFIKKQATKDLIASISRRNRYQTELDSYDVLVYAPALQALPKQTTFKSTVQISLSKADVKDKITIDLIKLPAAVPYVPTASFTINYNKHTEISISERDNIATGLYALTQQSRSKLSKPMFLYFTSHPIGESAHRQRLKRGVLDAQLDCDCNKISNNILGTEQENFCSSFMWAPLSSFSTFQVCPVVVCSKKSVISVAAAAPNYCDNMFGSCIAVTDDGRVYTWGDNRNGILGHGDTNSRPQPTLLQGVTGDRITFASFNQANTYAIALSASGTVFSWGSGRNGCLGLGEARDHSIPRVIQSLENRKVTKVALGESSVFAITSTRGMYAWGTMRYTSLNNVQAPLFVQSVQHVNFVDIDAGSNHVAAISNVGECYIWGQFTTVSGAYDIYKEPCAISFLASHHLVKVACGNSFTICLTSTGSLLTFGSGRNGCLGNKCYQSISPLKVTKREEIQDVFCVPQFGDDNPVVEVKAVGNTVIALTQNGDVWEWGNGMPMPLINVESQGKFVVGVHCSPKMCSITVVQNVHRWQALLPKIAPSDADKAARQNQSNAEASASFLNLDLNVIQKTGTYVTVQVYRYSLHLKFGNKNCIALCSENNTVFYTLPEGQTSFEKKIKLPTVSGKYRLCFCYTKEEIPKACDSDSYITVDSFGSSKVLLHIQSLPEQGQVAPGTKLQVNVHMDKECGTSDDELTIYNINDVANAKSLEPIRSMRIWKKSGVISFTVPSGAGTYIILLNKERYMLANDSKNIFTIVPGLGIDDSKYSVSISPSEVVSGEHVVVSWRSEVALSKKDFIALYKTDTNELANSIRTHGKQSGEKKVKMYKGGTFVAKYKVHQTTNEKNALFIEQPTSVLVTAAAVKAAAPASTNSSYENIMQFYTDAQKELQQNISELQAIFEEQLTNADSEEERRELQESFTAQCKNVQQEYTKKVQAKQAEQMQQAQLQQVRAQQAQLEKEKLQQAQLEQLRLQQAQLEKATIQQKQQQNLQANEPDVTPSKQLLLTNQRAGSVPSKSELVVSKGDKRIDIHSLLSYQANLLAEFKITIDKQTQLLKEQENVYKQLLNLIPTAQSSLTTSEPWNTTQWLRQHKLECYAEQFLSNDLTERETVAELSDSDLINSLRITSLGHRKKLLRAIRQLNT